MIMIRIIILHAAAFPYYYARLKKSTTGQPSTKAC